MPEERRLGPLRSYIVDLKGLFSSERPFSIPPYQRAYAWRHEEVNRLFEDLRDACHARRDYYFMGTIVLIVDRPETVEVVDGQQRLATFTLLLAALRDRLEAAGENDLAAALQNLISHESGCRLALRAADQDFLTTYVRTPGRIRDLCSLIEEAQRAEEEPDAMPQSQALLVFAAHTLTEALDGAEGLDQAAFARHIVSAAQFNVIETQDRAGAPQMFTVLNDTGLDLSAADLIKSELLAKARLSDSEAAQVANDWEGKVDLIGRSAMDELFKALPAVIAQDRSAAADAPGDWRTALTTVADPRRFLEVDLDRYVRSYHTIREASADYESWSDLINHRLRCLAMVQEKQWLPAAIWVFANTSKSEGSFVSRYLGGLERFAFACALAAIDSGARQSRMRRILRAGKDSVQLFGSRGAMVLSERERHQLMDRMCRPSKREAKRRRMVVFRANAALGEALDLNADDATVEHILPLKASGEWARVFTDPGLRAEQASAIGNLTLLTYAQNEAAADRAFARKREIYFQPNVIVRALTKDIRDVQRWDAGEIVNRTQRLRAALARDWGLDEAER
jgi:hypothetical protein